MTIEQSVATPLEQQMNGVDKMLYMQSTNANDGTMTLTVTFDVESEVNIDQVNAQMLLKTRHEAKGPLSHFFGAFNRWFAQVNHRYVDLSHGLIRKTAVSVLIPLPDKVGYAPRRVRHLRGPLLA